MTYKYLHFISVFAGLLISAQADIINLKKGLTKARTSHLDGINQKVNDEFISISKGLKVDRDGLIRFTVPAETAKKKVTYAYIGAGADPCKGNGKIRFKAQNQLEVRLYRNFFQQLFTAKETRYPFRRYMLRALRIPRQWWKAGVCLRLLREQMKWYYGLEREEAEKDYIREYIWTFSEISLEECAKLLPNSKEKNLLPLSSFGKCKAGSVKSGDFAFFAGPSKNRPLAEIIKKEKNILNVKYRKGNYPYPLFRVPKGKYYGSLAKFTCRVRGRGRITPTIWWFRNHVGHYYDGAIPVVFKQ